MTEITTTAVLSAGWMALFAAAGMNVRVYDVSPTAEADVNAYVDQAWPTLLELGLAVEGRQGKDHLSLQRGGSRVVGTIHSGKHA